MRKVSNNVSQMRNECFLVGDLSWHCKYSWSLPCDMKIFRASLFLHEFQKFIYGFLRTKLTITVDALKFDYQSIWMNIWDFRQYFQIRLYSFSLEVEIKWHFDSLIIVFCICSMFWLQFKYSCSHDRTFYFNMLL